MNKPNIVMIMVDQLRADCTGFMGHPVVKTPYLDSLATMGAVFENTYSATPTCIPARASLFTGLAPKNHGRVGYADGINWNYETTLASELSKAGYYTQCVGKMHVHPLRNLLGFHNIELHDGYLHYYRNANKPIREHQYFADDYLYWLKNECGIEADVLDTGIECNSWITRSWPYEEKYHPTNWVTTRSIDFLRRRDTSKPFFLMASYVRPHPPFDAPQYYLDLYKDAEIPESPIGDWVDENIFENRGKFYSSDIAPNDKELIRQAKIGYYACITHIDHQIGRLIEMLHEHNAYDNTIIMFISDHGELLMDHHLFRKSLPYEGSAHIPFLITGGYIAFQYKRGQYYKGVAELMDIMPTILDMANIEIPKNIDGKSLKPILENKEENVREFLHGEHLIYGGRSCHYVVSKVDKYIWFSNTGQEQYFDLENDPNECKNLINDEKYKERIDILRKYLIEDLKDREEGFSDGEKLIHNNNAKAVLSFLKEQN